MAVLPSDWRLPLSGIDTTEMLAPGNLALPANIFKENQSPKKKNLVPHG
jgi:hypothetical protein